MYWCVRARESRQFACSACAYAPVSAFQFVCVSQSVATCAFARCLVGLSKQPAPSARERVQLPGSNWRESSRLGFSCVVIPPGGFEWS